MFDFAIISLKKHYLAKSRNFKSPKSKIKGYWGQRAPTLGYFKNLLLLNAFLTYLS